MPRHLLVIIAICVLCLSVAVGLYFAQRDIEARLRSGDLATAPEYSGSTKSRSDSELNNDTGEADTAAGKPEPPEIFKLDLAWSYQPEDKIYAHVGYGYADGKRAIYRLYRREGQSGAWSLAGDSETPTTAVSLADRDADKIGTNYYYYATAIVGGMESVPSAIRRIKIVMPECYDTDRSPAHIMGIDYFKRGTIDGKTDYCRNEDSLVEYFCSPLGIGNSGKWCKNDCVEGACLPE
ncbi:MAG: hypothetical protein MUD10_04785 [Candidatus Pacebacteria bacterium]|jgi:hypothetical protein|nr:hypothetical protein [Candidatus Paceibacterota bacterium]